MAVTDPVVSHRSCWLPDPALCGGCCLLVGRTSSGGSCCRILGSLRPVLAHWWVECRSRDLATGPRGSRSWCQIASGWSQFLIQLGVGSGASQSLSEEGCRGFPDGSVVKNPPANAGDAVSILGSGTSSGGGNSNLLQYFCQDNPMHKEAWQATVCGVPKSPTEHTGKHHEGCH